MTGDHTGELAGIIDEFYAFIEHNRRLLALIERSALDIPELHAFCYTGLRRAYVGQLATYLRRGASSGDLRPVSDASVAPRFIVESIAWFAWHRTADPDSDLVTNEQARQAVKELLLAAFVLSADASPGVIRRLLAGGALTYLTKPIDLAELGTLLDTFAVTQAQDRQAPPGGRIVPV